MFHGSLRELAMPGLCLPALACPGTLPGKVARSFGGAAVLRVLSSSKRLCDGTTRRDFLQVGGLGALGLGLDQLFHLHRAQAALPSRPRDSSFGRAKNVILLYLFGGPSHLETLDMKPDAAAEIRGVFK